MRLLAVLSLVLTPLVKLPAADSPSIRLVGDRSSAAAAIVVEGIPKELQARLAELKPIAKEWPSIFRVVVSGGNEVELLARPPLAGTYSMTESGISFEPLFPFVAGRDYVAILQMDSNAKPIRVTLTLPKPAPRPRTHVTAVYPSANQLPENMLRFYVHFSGEVARGDIYRHFKLVRDDGLEVKEPFLELDEELWSTDGNRLTVLFHPGRVKRELVPREELGPILEEGRTYTLSISGKWQDTEGRPILAGVSKSFHVGPADPAPVDPAVWALIPPRAGRDSPLILRLPKSLDHAMLGRVVWVADAQGERVPGTLTVGGGERVLTFAPKNPWKPGDYKLIADTRLEDVCGNRVGEPFEVDVFKPVTRAIESKTFERPFSVR
jgi:hypothetical protein